MLKMLIIVAADSVHSTRYVQALSEQLANTQFQQIIFITNHNAHYTATSFPANVTLKTVNFSLFNVLAAKKIATIIQAYANATIHIHQANSYAYHTIKAVKLTQLKYKIVLTTWGSDVLLLPKQNVLYKHMVRFNLAHADVVTADSLYVTARIKELCPQVRNLHTINFGVEYFPNRLMMEHKANIILSNRLHKPLYNIDKIIMAFAKLCSQLPNLGWQLVVAASGNDSDKLRQLAATFNLSQQQIIFTGMLSTHELAIWYQKAKIFVSVPNSDATSLSLLEAMSYGCYPLVSNLPANLEWVMDGVNGSICQNVDTLECDLQATIEFVTSAARYKDMAPFNYTVIKHKAVFASNIKRFIALL